MRVQGKELFKTNEVQNYMGKFEDKLQESNNKINQHKSDIEGLEIEADLALEADIIEGSTSTKKLLNNLQARKLNSENQLNTEIIKALKIKEIMGTGMSKLVPEASRQLDSDLMLYHEKVEKEVYRQLMELRKAQEKLLLTLQVAHNNITNELSQFNEICYLFELERYKKSVSNEQFHSNLFMANRSYPQYGSPLINCNSLQAIEDRIMRARADANAIYNTGKAETEREQLPMSMEYKDIDLEKFLDKL